jgi:hypothetical protein
MGRAGGVTTTDGILALARRQRLRVPPVTRTPSFCESYSIALICDTVRASRVSEVVTEVSKIGEHLPLLLLLFPFSCLREGSSNASVISSIASF